jgi:hypothetical protein
LHQVKNRTQARGRRPGAYADVGREEFEIAPNGLVAEVRDQRQHDIWRSQIWSDLGLMQGTGELIKRQRLNIRRRSRGCQC